tara:strand:- start:1410 stop:1841 length:432 start_codon:yes stop_codon:yes gene_type:complete
MNLLEIEKIKKEGKRIGFTCSTFDLLHAGHTSMLAESKSKCDYLIVGLLCDPTHDRQEKQKPVQSMFERWVQLSSISYIDMIIPFSSEQDIIDMVLVIKPDIRIVGEEYKDMEHTGKGLCPIFYNSRKHSFSSTELRERVKNG